MSSYIEITGGQKLIGTIPVSGSKNAALPIICGTLLTAEPVHLSNLPQLTDIKTLLRLLETFGVSVEGDFLKGGSNATLTAANITNHEATYDLVKQMRASILVLGPILARFGKARVSLPGGCAIGARPVDLHLHAMRELGAEVEIHEGYIEAVAPKGLQGNVITFPKISVGATENAILAACLAKGETLLQNVAQEPEIDDLIHMLKNMGAHIEKVDPQSLVIQGQDSLSGSKHHIMSDRIEMGTYAIAAAITDGNILLQGHQLDHMNPACQILKKAGVDFVDENGSLRVRKGERTDDHLEIITQPYPGFPTDLQAQTMALLSVTKGVSQIKETIFENRFMHVPELLRMGADISLNGSIADINGVATYRGAEVMATDLRASVSLALAGLAAEGKTHIHRIYHLDRGYEKIEEKLSNCGAQIIRKQSDK